VSELALQFESIHAPLQDAERAGLVKRRSSSAGYFDMFRDRSCFRFCLLRETSLVLCRIINEGNPKYLNSPDTPVFHKGKTLYGLFETAKYIRSEDQAIVVEGYMDLLALYQYGFKNVVATLGTALTSDHARLLKRYTSNILVLFDGDEAGQTAQAKSLNVYWLRDSCQKDFAPDLLDPDEFLKKRAAEKVLKDLKPFCRKRLTSS